MSNVPEQVKALSQDTVRPHRGYSRCVYDALFIQAAPMRYLALLAAADIMRTDSSSGKNKEIPDAKKKRSTLLGCWRAGFVIPIAGVEPEGESRFKLDWERTVWRIPTAEERERIRTQGRFCFSEGGNTVEQKGYNKRVIEKPEDSIIVMASEADKAASGLGMAVMGIYGCFIGIAATLIVQWLVERYF